MSAQPHRGLAADDVVGGYELLRRLGKGAMAEVWLGRRAGRRSKHVALKVILPELVGQPRYSRMFLAEAELSGMLSHSNIVQVFDEGEDNGVSYLVMEWVDGINLVRLREAMKLIDDPKLRSSISAYVVGQLLHALSYAHSVTGDDGVGLGIVHRDVSPQNVLLSTSGDVKLADFGVAHTVIEESSGMHVKGKLRYMAPDQLAGNTRSPQIDLYGAGAILTELLEGAKFRGDFDDDRKLHAQVFSGQIPALSQPCPPALERVRVALLQPDPTQRVATADQALAILREFDGYRDMRLELSKICGSLTGVARPRTGPGQAAAPVAAVPVAEVPVAAPVPVAVPAPVAAPQLSAPAPESTVMLPGGGVPVRGAGLSQPLHEPTTFLSEHGQGNPAPSVAAPPRSEPMPELTALVAPNFGPAPARAPVVARPTPRGPANAFDPGVAAVDDRSMTRFAVDERSGKSILLLFAVGLVLALGGAGVVAYILLSGEDVESRASPKIAPTPVDASGESKPARPAAVAPNHGLVIGEEPAAPELAPSPTAVAEPVPAAEADAPPDPGDNDTPPPVDEVPPPSEPEAPPLPSAAAPKSKSKSKSKAGPPVIVHLRTDGVPAAWVKVAGRSMKIGGGSNLKISSGRHTVFKRHAASDKYKSCGKHTFGAGKDWKLYVGSSGCRVQSF